MSKTDTGLLRVIETLARKMRDLSGRAENTEQQEQAACALKCLTSLTEAVASDKVIFGIEPWHPLEDDVPLPRPGEMLLRLKDEDGEAMPPYPAIMAFYRNGMTAEIDTALFLCALRQFEETGEKQVSINASARSLRDPHFIKTILRRVEAMELRRDKKIIIEIHESTPHLKMSKHVLRMFRDAGVLFAIDDVGLSMQDALRMSEFEDIADFIKIDRHSVCTHPENPNSLDHVVSFIGSMLPDAVMVAEGVKDAAHAKQIHEYHPRVKYVQGLYLPGREEFAREWEEINKQPQIATV